MWTLEMFGDNPPIPKRGDLIHTNVGSKRERTWLILRVIQMRRCHNKYKVLKARWWELTPKVRMALFRSAERNGGQEVIYTEPIRKLKSKRTFDSQMETVRTDLAKLEDEYPTPSKDQDMW